MDNTKINDKYEVWLMAISVSVIIVMILTLTAYPDWGANIASNAFNFMSVRFGSTMQVIGVGALIFLIWMAMSKYGAIQLDGNKPEHSNFSWYAMMFFCGNGAGTLYWVFLEWGYHFNANLQLGGVAVSEAMNYERALAYSIFDWGPSMWAVCGLFIIPFAYHYHIKKDGKMKLSQLCKYTIGQKRVDGMWGKLIDFLFIFAAVGSISITAGTSGSTMAVTLADFLGINSTFGLTVAILLFSALLYTVSSLVGIEKGMRRISGFNIYFSSALLLLILLLGPTQFILDSIVNALGIVGNDFLRMSLWTDPVAQSGYPQSWTTFYLVYFFVFGPFTGLFVAKVSKGRSIKEVIIAYITFCTAGAIALFGIVGGYQQFARMSGGLDVPAMLQNGEAANIASQTLQSLPFPTISTILYFVAILLFLATTLDACSFTLSSTISKKLKTNEEPNKYLKFIWCLILVALPIAITYAGTNVNTVKSIVLATGLPLAILIFIIYSGIMKEMKKDFGSMTREEISKKM